MDPQSDDGHNTSHPFSDDKQPTRKEDIGREEPSGNSDFGYSSSQPSNSALRETEEVSEEFSALSEERSETIEEKPTNNLIAPLRDNLDGKLLLYLGASKFILAGLYSSTFA